MYITGFLETHPGHSSRTPANLDERQGGCGVDKNSFNGGRWVRNCQKQVADSVCRKHSDSKRKAHFFFMWFYGLHIISHSVLFQALESLEYSFSFACSAEV